MQPAQISEEHRPMVEAFVKLRSDMSSLTSEINEYKGLIKSLEEDQKGYQMELMGLERWLRRHNINPDEISDAVQTPEADTPSNVVSLAEFTAEAPSGEGYQPLEGLSRVDAVAAVLSTAKAPMSRTDIHEHLAMGGRDETLDQVSLTLSGLKRADRAYTVTRGQWLATLT